MNQVELIEEEIWEIKARIEDSDIELREINMEIGDEEFVLNDLKQTNARAKDIDIQYSILGDVYEKREEFMRVLYELKKQLNELENELVLAQNKREDLTKLLNKKVYMDLVSIIMEYVY